jgi:hypothetical protein
MRSIYFFLFLLFLELGCKYHPATKQIPDPEQLSAYYRQIHSLIPLLQSGDLIFRNGTDEVSRAARSFNRKDTSYSHCGLVFLENDTPVVYHALGGIYNPSQKLLRQPLDSFCNPSENNAIGIYRYPLNSEENQRLHETVLAYYKAGLKFDLYFNYKTDDRMYCAEFVFKSLNKSLNGSLTSYVRTDTIPFGVTTDDLFLHPDSRLIKKENFLY